MSWQLSAILFTVLFMFIDGGFFRITDIVFYYSAFKHSDIKIFKTHL